MKKVTKNVAMIVMAALMMVSCLTTAFAHAEEPCSEIMVEPRYVIYCENSDYQGRHAVKMCGDAIVYVNGQHSFDGYAYQCEKCDQVIITQYRAKTSNYIGMYATYDPGYRIGNGVTVAKVSKAYSNTSNCTVTGYYFK